ncbi:MAG: nitroreductase family protein [Clostridium sp.]|nr:nitroreductase family protein [Clostridium sp.]
MDFLGLAKQRYSVRGYMDRKVESEKLEKILEAGRIAPTACNMQPQKLIVVQGEEGLKKIGLSANIYGAPLAIIVCSDNTKSWTRFFDSKQYSDIDASIVTDHMMLEAADLGLGSVWIGYFDPEIIRREFKLPEEIEPINILAVGYASKNTEAAHNHLSNRKCIDELVCYETYKS